MTRARIGMVIALTCVFLVSFAVACGDDTSTPPGGKSGDDDDDKGTSSSSGGVVASALSMEKCKRYDRCIPGSVASGWGDIATCGKSLERLFGPQKALNGSGMTTSALDACVQKLKTADCSIFEGDIPECFFKGTLKEGDSCSSGVQCATGSCFFTDDTSACGKCTATVAVGQSCTKADCNLGSFCDDNDKCVAPAAEGGACQISEDCAAGLVCVTEKCAKAIPKDGACTQATPDDDNPCAEGFACLGGKCASVAVTAKTGEACSPSIGCINGVCLGAKCVANGKEGGTCDDNSDSLPPCQAPMACLSSKCAYEEFAACK